MFVPRKTRPEKGNRYYITISAGGWSRAIKGKPTDPDCNVLHNCVGYAYGRFHEIAQRKEMDMFDPVNAEAIFENAKKHGLKVGKVPKVGALIVWQKGQQGGADGAGHVAVVEEIGVGGDITTSESGYGAKYPFWTAHYKPPYNYKSGYTFLGFVYQPEPVPAQTIRKGDKGEAVTWMQEHLARAGYLRAREVDGDFGKITLGALLAFQLESGLQVDGVCGAATKKALGVI